MLTLSGRSSVGAVMTCCYGGLVLIVGGVKYIRKAVRQPQTSTDGGVVMEASTEGRLVMELKIPDTDKLILREAL